MTILAEGLARYLSPQERARLAAQRIGIAGLGGIGSNVAILLARTGVQHFFLIDYDHVEPSNLNRQNYEPEDVGKKKTVATYEKIHRLNPEIQAEILCARITEKNVDECLGMADLWVEALDGARDKAMLAQAAVRSGKTIVCASGIAGFGGPALTQKAIGKIIIVGDGSSDIASAPPLAPRVVWAAAMMADALLTHILRPPLDKHSP